MGSPRGGVGSNGKDPRKPLSLEVKGSVDAITRSSDHSPTVPTAHPMARPRSGSVAFQEEPVRFTSDQPIQPRVPSAPPISINLGQDHERQDRHERDQRFT
jgi:hypothetical protein